MRNYLVFMILGLVFIVTSASGCQSLDVQDTAIAIGAAADWKDEEFIVSIQVAKHMTQEQGTSPEEVQFEVISEQGKSVSDAARRISLTLPRIPLWFHASTLVLGEDIAEHRLTEMADFLARNRNVRKNTLIVVARGSLGSELLKVNTPLEPHSAVGIRRILENQEEQAGIYMLVTLGDFLQNLTMPGIDPVIPEVAIVSDHGKPLIKAVGTAVFSGPVMVGELNESESRGFRFLSDKSIRGGLIIIPAPDDEQRNVTIELIASQAQTIPVFQNGELRMKIKVLADGNFYEQTSSQPLLELATFKEMEYLTAQQMKKEMYKAIGKAQLYQADILGWGRLLEIYHPAIWKQVEKDWPQIFPDIETDIDVEFSLRRTYLTDQSFTFN